MFQRREEECDRYRNGLAVDVLELLKHNVIMSGLLYMNGWTDVSGRSSKVTDFLDASTS